MRSIVVLVLCVLATASAFTAVDLFSEEWHAFKREHNKNYDSEVEESFRMKIFAKNKFDIAKHNQRFAAGLVSYKLKLNKYADMPRYEFIHTMNGFNGTLAFRVGEDSATFISPAHASLPGHVDWRTEGAVTAVKDQGRCGSCWSFSATGALEGQHYRKTGYLISLSEQNLLDCSQAYGNNGCKGGLMDNAFKYIKDNHGIDTEKSYPYEAIMSICRFNAANVGATDVGHAYVQRGDEQHLMQAVATIGPIAVAIDASLQSFHFYSSGVYYDAKCSPTKLNHAVLIVGYGTDEEGGDYWLVKNSWGSSWGDAGYIKMARNRRNHCGIASYATYPLV